VEGAEGTPLDVVVEAPDTGGGGSGAANNGG
jgi:hypothetical protein